MYILKILSISVTLYILAILSISVTLYILAMLSISVTLYILTIPSISVILYILAILSISVTLNILTILSISVTLYILAILSLPVELYITALTRQQLCAPLPLIYVDTVAFNVPPEELTTVHPSWPLADHTPRRVHWYPGHGQIIIISTQAEFQCALSQH